jgi:hypothetical protein
MKESLMLNISLGKDKISSFTKPLNALMQTITNDDGGIILNFDQKSKECNVYVKKDSIGTLIFLKYKAALLQDMQIDKDESIGVMKISDFVKYFSIIDDSKIQMKYENSSFALNGDDSECSFRTADVDMIKEGLKNFKGATYFAEIAVDSKFDKLSKAMNVLAEEDCVFIKGSASESTVTFTVRSSGVELNKFCLKVITPVTQDFEIPYNKDILQTALNAPASNIKLSLAERFVSICADCDEFSMTYYIAKKAIK